MPLPRFNRKPLPVDLLYVLDEAKPGELPNFLFAGPGCEWFLSRMGHESEQLVRLTPDKPARPLSTSKP